MRRPQVTIIMATYNRAHFISETLDSIQSQTFANWECLIIDDGSTDGTLQVLEPYLKDSQFNYISRSPKYRKGLPGCRNMGVDLATGDYIIFFDDDDIVHPENLKTCLDLLKGSEFSFCRYDKKPFDRTGKNFKFNCIQKSNAKCFKISDLDRMVTGEVPFASCCVMWHKRCFQNLRFNEDLMYAEEWECYIRILSEGFSGISIDQFLYYNRKHPNSNTGEFYRNDQVRFDSKIKATELVIKNLALSNLLSPELKKYFIRLGFHLNSRKVIEQTLKNTRSGAIEKLKYRVGL